MRRQLQTEVVLARFSDSIPHFEGMWAVAFDIDHLRCFGRHLSVCLCIATMHVTVPLLQT